MGSRQGTEPGEVQAKITAGGEQREDGAGGERAGADSGAGCAGLYEISVHRLVQ